MVYKMVEGMNPAKRSRVNSSLIPHLADRDSRQQEGSSNNRIIRVQEGNMVQVVDSITHNTRQGDNNSSSSSEVAG